MLLVLPTNQNELQKLLICSDKDLSLDYVIGTLSISRELNSGQQFAFACQFFYLLNQNTDLGS